MCQVLLYRITRKLTATDQQLSKENTELKSTINQQAAELAEYKKPATISVKTLMKSAKEISEKERLRSDLQKAKSFILANGLTNTNQT